MNFTRVSLLCLVISLAAALAVSAQGSRYTIQIAAASTQEEAEARVSQLKAQGVEAYWVRSHVPGKGLLYRVRTGRFPTRAAAREYGERLRQKGIAPDFFVADYEAPAPAAPASGPKVQAVGGAISPPPATRPTTAPVANVETAKTPLSAPATATPSPAPGYLRFEDKTAGYSFDHPNYWVGSALGSEEAKTQHIDAGATFKSNEDAAFLSVIWNGLEGANSARHDNNLIVELIIKSMGTSADTQSLTETSRRMTTEGDQIKTFLELRALFRDPRSQAPLDFLGKAVIIRAGRGILLVAVFYAKDGPPNAAQVAERIIQSSRVSS
jgi:hypothetical protein